MEKALMKLAGSSYWQNLYKASKEGLVQLFDNRSNLSGLQSEFLFYLRIYEICYEELNNKSYPFLDEKLLKDPERVKAFMYWRKNYLDKKDKESKNTGKVKKQPRKQFKIYDGPRPDAKIKVEEKVSK